MHPTVTAMVAEQRRNDLYAEAAQIRRAHAVGGRSASRQARLTVLAAGVVSGALAAALSAAPSAEAAPAPPEVPGLIDVPEGHKVFLAGHAEGVQIYRCDGESWNLVAPRADLFDDNGKPLGTHFGGPTWQARDGSFVKAQRVDGVTVDATAVQWLLLSATEQTAGADGGRLASTSFVQRTATVGGLPPNPADCNASTAADTEEVPYTADYHFWKPITQ